MHDEFKANLRKLLSMSLINYGSFCGFNVHSRSVDPCLTGSGSRVSPATCPLSHKPSGHSPAVSAHAVDVFKVSFLSNCFLKKTW